MKKCGTCGEEFGDKFVFCPVDGSALGPTAPTAQESAHPLPASQTESEFKVCIIEEPGYLSGIVKWLSDLTRPLEPPARVARENPVRMRLSELIDEITFYTSMMCLLAVETICFVVLVIAHAVAEHYTQGMISPFGKLCAEGLGILLMVVNSLVIANFAFRRFNRRP